MVEPAVVLVHSPLVGPSSWLPAADELRARGHAVLVPTLVDALASTDRDYHQVLGKTVYDAIRGQLDPPVVLVVHSGAGELVPSFVQPSPVLVAAVVYVDAALPHPGRSRLDSAPPELGERIEQLAEPDGFLRPWHEWFPPGMLDEWIPDRKARSVLFTEMPRVPLSYFQEPAPVLDAWRDAPSGYLQLSPGYESAAGEARDREWPVKTLDGHHLSAVTDPVDVVEAMVTLINQVQ